MSKPGMKKAQLHRFAGILDRTVLGTGALIVENDEIIQAPSKLSAKGDNEIGGDGLVDGGYGYCLCR